jgi:arylsulfatase A-like enzyme
MPTRRAIVIAVDGLRASALGAYGNAWHATPALDRLASESLVVDWLIADSPELAGFYRAAWFGLAPPADGVECDLTALGAEAGLPRRLEAAGVRTALVTDDHWLAVQADQLGFHDVRAAEFPPPATAADVADTELAQLFALVAEQVEQWADAPAADTAPRLLWIHARGYRGAWDAPTEWRQSLLDGEDPPAQAFAVPPARLSSRDHDELLQHRAAYAAQTMVLDDCIALVLATLQATGLADDTLVALVGARGFALGEHGEVGTDVRALYGELTHLPLFVRLPGGHVAPPRSDELLQPVDLATSLASWFGAAPGPNAARDLLSLQAVGGPPRREAAFSVGRAGEVAVRTASWQLRQAGGDGEESQLELFAKPDDRWEANEIADRCPAELASMLALAARVRGLSLAVDI